MIKAIRIILTSVTLLFALGILPTVASTVSPFGQLMATGRLSVDSAGMRVPLAAGQDYLVFSGDTVTSARGAGGNISLWSGQATVGTVRLDGETTVRVALDQGRHVVHLERGRLLYQLSDAAVLEVVVAPEVIALQGGQGVIAPAADGKVQHLVLQRGDSATPGQAQLQLAQAQPGAGAAGTGAAGTGMAGLGGMAGGLGVAAAAAGALAVGGVVVAATGGNDGPRTGPSPVIPPPRDDRPPASPIAGRPQDQCILICNRTNTSCLQTARSPAAIAQCNADAAICRDNCQRTGLPTNGPTSPLWDDLLRPVLGAVGETGDDD